MKKIGWLLFFVICFVQGWSQEIKGVVVAESDKMPIPGVNVIVKGTKIGTSTDFDGNFTISLPKKGDVLIFSVLGMKTQEVNPQGKNFLKIEMQDDVQQIEEVVVTGYQKIDKKLFAGSTVKVEARDVKLEGVTDATRGLQGQVSGVQIENVSGTFGAAPAVRIRGASSVLGNNNPLWVIDGVVMEDAVDLSAEDLTSGDLNTALSSSVVGINPEDIASFQVLKDASATALYGTRAMNGVIVITTKKGKKGSLSLNYVTNVTLRERPRYSQFNFLNSAEEMAVYQELYEKGWIDIVNSNTGKTHGALSKMFSEIAEKRLNWGSNGGLNYEYLQRYADANTDWFKTLFKEQFMSQHSLSINAGSDLARVRASIGYLGDPGQTIADKVDNYTASINADFSLSEKFNLGIKLTGNVRDQNLAASENRTFDAVSGTYQRNFDINPFNYAVYTSRSITPYDANGKREFFRRNFAPFNILSELDYNTQNIKLQDFSVQLDSDYKFFKGLTWRASFQRRWFNSSSTHDIHEKSNYANAYRADNPNFRDDNFFLYKDPNNPNDPPFSVLPSGGFKKETHNTLTSYYLRNIIDYNPKIDEDNNHSVTLMLGQELRYIDRTFDRNDGWGYVYDRGGVVVTNPNFIKFLEEKGETYYDSQFTKNRSFGVFSSVGYAYLGKYILNGTFRYDGDNRTGHPAYLPTWNVSAAWNLGRESWLLNNETVNALKLKATYGLTGDNPAYSGGSVIIEGNKPLRPHILDREVGLLISYLADEDLTFEKQYEWNFGVEGAFFNNRVFAELEYYRRHSLDLLGIIQVNGVGGVYQKYGNVGEMKSEGVDASLRTINVETKDFQWATTFTYSYNKNRITKWLGHDRVGDAVQRTGANLEGYPKGAIFSIPFAGLDTDGVPVFYDENGQKTQKINFQNRDNLDKILKYEGQSLPKATGGLVNTFRYKNWDLNVGLVFQYGNKIRLDDAFYSSYQDSEALTGELVNRWQFPGDEKLTDVPAIITKRKQQQLANAGLNPYEMYNKSDLRVADGSFVRLKSLRLSYNVAKENLKHTPFDGIGINLSAYNLWLLYSDEKLHGLDPEFYQSGGIALPLSRSYTLTFNFKF